MKTLTEFSGTMIRMAARAEAEARKNLPPELTRVAPAKAVSEGVSAKPNENASAPAGVPGGADSATDAADQALAQQAVGGSDVVGVGAQEPKLGEAGTTEDEMQPGAEEEEAVEEAAAGADLSGDGTPHLHNTPGGAKPSEVNADEGGTPRAETEGETSAVKELLDKAVSEATGTTGDRLERLREALQAAGKQSERVRLVRVFSSEEPVAGAKKIGEHQYMVDLMPHSMKQNFERDEKASRRGPKRPSGGKQKGPEGSLEGSFSMESVMQDRRSERGPGGGAGRGRPGGRGGPGGARPGGGRPGGGRPGGGRGPGGSKPGGAPKS
ncbi:MAG TPA: translation initiation factor 2 [Myxococcales bacterium]|nr:translation initiation factor 2 [Myxococcales bacterium]